MTMVLRRFQRVLRHPYELRLNFPGGDARLLDTSHNFFQSCATPLHMAPPCFDEHPKNYCAARKVWRTLFLVKTRETEDTNVRPLPPRESSKRKWTARLAQRVSQQDEN